MSLRKTAAQIAPRWVHICVHYLLRQWRMALRLRMGEGPWKVHVGCGNRKLDGFINIDARWSHACDYVCPAQSLPCRPGSVERIESYHMIEHLPHPQVADTLRAWYSVLQAGGVLVIECPDFDEAVRQYQAGREERLLNIFGRQRFPGDAHLFGYNEKRLTELLASAGFENITSVSPQDYHAEQEPCLRIEAYKPQK